MSSAIEAIPAPAIYVRLLLDTFGQSAERRAALLHGTRLTERVLNGGTAETSLFSMLAFAQNLSVLVGDTWPIDAVHVWRAQAQGALEVAVRSAATIDGSLSTLEAFGHVRGPYLKMSLKRSRSAARLVFGCKVAMEPDTAKALRETAALSSIFMLEALLGTRSTHLSLNLPGRTKDYIARVSTTIRGRVLQTPGEVFIAVPRALLSLPSPYADKGLERAAQRELQRAARQADGSGDMLVVQIDSLLAGADRRLLEEDVARMLGLSRRTLVRRLSRAGTSYRLILDNHLKRHALAMIGQGHRRSEVAAALFYSDPTSLSRALRRWVPPIRALFTGPRLRASAIERSGSRLP
ncbi:helix-turn-helix transcriptional regulator [Allosphingosinicella deserti]|uniref:AraC family transcriptional regulator n=1 Tax=Allosphingosinicella deserti TaxID=2116704 RepID=UPI0011B2719B|nr:AraC family transcriptional regulator [Sphingomonas deserti]